MRECICATATLLVLSSFAIAARNLVVVNGLGETADFINLTDSTVTLNFDLLGLYPNDFLVAENTGIAINSGSNDLYFYNMETLSRIGTLFLGANRNPWSGAFLHPDTVVITNFVSLTITEVDVLNRTVIGEYPVGDSLDSDSPEGILIIGRKAYICLTSFDELFQYDQGKVAIFDLDANATVARLTVGINPQSIAQGYDGYLYVLCTGNYEDVEGWLYRLNPQTNTVADSLFVGGYPGSIAVTRQKLAFLAAGGWPPLTFGSGVPDVRPEALSPNDLPSWRGSSRLTKGEGKSVVSLHRLRNDNPPNPPFLRGTRCPSVCNEGHGTASCLRQSLRSNQGGLIYTANLNAWSMVHGPSNPLTTDWGVVSVKTVSDSTVVSCNFSDDTVTELDSAGSLLARFHVGDGPVAVAKYPECFFLRGDVNGSGIINIADAVYLVSYIFSEGSPPIAQRSGDFNCNSITNIADAVAIIQFIFAGGSNLCRCAD